MTLINNYGYDLYQYQELLATNFETHVASQMTVPPDRLVSTYSDNRVKVSNLLSSYFYKRLGNQVDERYSKFPSKKRKMR